MVRDVLSCLLALMAVGGIGWGARRRLDRASRDADPERARTGRELSRQVDRGRGYWWL